MKSGAIPIARQRTKVRFRHKRYAMAQSKQVSTIIKSNFIRYISGGDINCQTDIKYILLIVIRVVVCVTVSKSLKYILFECIFSYLICVISYNGNKTNYG